MTPYPRTPFVAAVVCVCSCLAPVRGFAFPSDATSGNVLYEGTFDTGFVFLLDRSLPAPYVIRATRDTVSINGVAIPWTALDLPEFEPEDAAAEDQVRERRAKPDRRQRTLVTFRERRREPGEKQGRRERRREGKRGQAVLLAQYLGGSLGIDAAIVAMPDRPLAYFATPTERDQLFRAVLAPQSTDCQTFLASRGSSDDQAAWTSWINGLQMDTESRARAESFVDVVAAADVQNKADVRAVRNIDKTAYPFTVLGMVLGVLALGHLLKSFSKIDVAESNDVLRATTISIGLMVVLSALDLTWTLLASQAGQMRELNPFGSRFIEDPETLIAFKFAATLVGCGLLFALRHHRRARHACWWLCLVCTVLTFRWVMFNSMFVA